MRMRRRMVEGVDDAVELVRCLGRRQTQKARRAAVLARALRPAAARRRRGLAVGGGGGSRTSWPAGRVPASASFPAAGGRHWRMPCAAGGGGGPWPGPRVVGEGVGVNISTRCCPGQVEQMPLCGAGGVQVRPHSGQRLRGAVGLMVGRGSAQEGTAWGGGPLRMHPGQHVSARFHPSGRGSLGWCPHSDAQWAPQA